MKRAFLLLVVLVAITAALVWWILERQQADPTFAPRLSVRTWRSGGPLVAIDDAHWNVHTTKRGYAPFAKLLLHDGYTVLEHGNVASEAVQSAARVIVIANAMGLRGLLRQLGQMVGLTLDGLAADAFDSDEADAIEAWVHEGGSLLLIADHAPAGRAVQSVAERFGVTMHDSFVVDPDNSEPDAPETLVFSRLTKTLGAHVIMNQRDRVDAINRIVTFSGQALEGPPHATALLIFSPSAFEVPRQDAGEDERVPVAGLAQALALAHGKGRVVVLGEAAVLTSQVVTEGETLRIGLAWPNSDNERFARRIMGWLSYAGE